MASIEKALTWSGSGAELLLFAVFAEPPPPDLFTEVTSTEVVVRRYALDDEGGVLTGRTLFEFDFVLKSVPRSLGEMLVGLLGRARGAGAVVAWFGFEGSFDFNHVLTGDVAHLAYALTDSEGTSVATDADLDSPMWRARVVRAGERARGVGAQPGS